MKCFLAPAAVSEQQEFKWRRCLFFYTFVACEKIMLEKINRLLEEVENFTAQSKEQVEEYRIKWLSKKGEVSALFDDFKNVQSELKKEVGQKLNRLKDKAQEKINALRAEFENGHEE